MLFSFCLVDLVSRVSESCQRREEQSVEDEHYPKVFKVLALEVGVYYPEEQDNVNQRVKKTPIFRRRAS